MDSQLQRWVGKFGNEYIARSLLSPDVILRRAQSFETILRGIVPFPSFVLEVGCNIGANLQALYREFPNLKILAGVEPNERARRIAQMSGFTVFPDCGQEMNFPDAYFDLVFCCGVLIHCVLEEAERIVREMQRVSKRYLLFMEYHGMEDKEIDGYHDEKHLLWQRPWNRHFENWGLGQPVGFGFLNLEQGFDDVGWGLYHK